MICPRNPSDDELIAYLRDPYSDEGAIADHLDDCPECDERAERLRVDLAPAGPSPGLIDNLLLLDFPAEPVPEDQKPRIEGYEVLGVIGRGGMGVVYKAWHAKYRVVALKVLLREALASPAEIEQARREAHEAKAAWEQAVAAGDPAPPYVRVYEIGRTDDGVHFIAMELVPADTLQDRLPDLSGDHREAARWLQTVASAVHGMHDRGVVHRDLTTKNILLRLRAGRPVPGNRGRAPLGDLDPLVSDYGLVKRIDSTGQTLPEVAKTSPGALKGTPHYLAPELIRGGSTHAHPGSDIFALGVILYQILTGRKPFEGDTILDIQNAIVRDEPSRPRGPDRRVSRDLAAICLRCLEKDPARRYATAADLALDLGRFLAEDRKDPVRARLPGAGLRLWRWCRRYPWAAALLVVATLTAGSFAWGFRRDRDAARAEAGEARAQAGAATRDAEASRARADLESEKVKARDRSLHEGRVQEARAAARRGDWPTALQAYRRAIEDRAADEVPLRAERLFGFFAVNDQAGLVAELDALGRRPDLGRLAAHLALVRGAHLLCDPGRQEEGRTAVRRALEARGDLLSEADALFARALAETHARPMIQALREALKADALHYPARASLVVALIASGQPDRALAEADLMAGLFPDSAVPDFARTFDALIRGDRGAMHAGLEATAGRLKVDPKPLRSYLDGMADMLDVMARAEDGPGMISWGTQARLFLLALPLKEKTKDVGKPLAFAIPSISLVFRWYGEVYSVTRNGIPGDEPALRKLVDLGRSQPEALIQCLILGKRLVEANALVAANRPGGVREALAEVSELGYSAAEAPSILVRSPIRYQSRLIGMFADVCLLKLDPADDRPRVLRIRENLHRLVADGRRWPSARRQCISHLITTIISLPSPELAADWRPGNPGGADALRRRNWQLSRLGRALIEDWMDDAPEDREARRLLDELDRWAERHRDP